MIYHKEDRADFRVTQSQIPVSLLSNIIELRTARNRVLMVGSFDSPGQKSGLVHKTQNKTPFWLYIITLSGPFRVFHNLRTLENSLTSKKEGVR